jgi:hypothetical protein
MHLLVFYEDKCAFVGLYYTITLHDYIKMHGAKNHNRASYWITENIEYEFVFNII